MECLSVSRHRTRRAVLGDPAAAVCWVTGLVVAALWLSGTGFDSLTRSPADLLTSIGRLSGLVSADLLLIQVVLMARVPVIERSLGQDELARRHRAVGFWSFTLLLLHILLVTVGYSMGTDLGVLQQAWDLLAHYAGMLLAAAATVALTVVSLTSVRRARRRLRYESWHLLHLYAYVGVAASVPHEIWTGADFATSWLARTYWWSSYAVAAIAVLVFRVGLPVWRSLRHGITVTSVVRESDDVVTVHMGGRGLSRLPVRAGQFFVWRFLDGPGWSRGNPYSLSAAPRHDRVQITARTSGDGGARLAELRPGTRVLIEGPYGRLTGERRIGRRVAMFACGIGITPMRALLEDLPYAPGDAVLVYRARSERDLVFRSELEALAARREIVLRYLLGPRGSGRNSWLPASATGWGDTEALLCLLPDLSTFDVFVCGPEAWTDAVSRAALAAGLPEGQLHRERFSW